MAHQTAAPIVLGDPIGSSHDLNDESAHLSTSGIGASQQSGSVSATPTLHNGSNDIDAGNVALSPTPIDHHDHEHAAMRAVSTSSSGNDTLLNNRDRERDLNEKDAESDQDQLKPLAHDHFLQDNQAMRPSAHSSMDHIADLGESHVSVRRGKSEFAALERRFSNMSQHSQELQRSTTRRSIRSGFVKPEKVTSTVSRHEDAVGEAEKGQKKDEDEFDLAEVLQSGSEKRDEAGIKKKRVGVVWEDLEVVGGGGLRINIRNFLSAIIEQFLMPALAILGLFGYKPFATKPKTILHKNSGVLRPGEMCLVLGRPGSGCSTFLKSITNQRDSYLAVNGDVSYAGVGWKEMHKLYAG